MLVAGALTIVMNWVILIRWWVARRRSTMTLVAGGLLGLVGAALCPFVSWKYGLLAILIDPGCFSFLLALFHVPNWYTRRRKKRLLAHSDIDSASQD